MYINAENFHNIAIKTTEKPVDLAQFTHFIAKSPFVRRIAFIGKAIFDCPNFPQLVKMCAINNITLIFGEMETTSIENLRALVEYRNVLFVNVKDDGTNIKTLEKLKQEYNSEYPEINKIVPIDAHIIQDELSDTSYAFYNLADDIEHIACTNLLLEPMFNYDGTLFGCWQCPKIKNTINAFDLGMEKTLNHRFYKNMIKMISTGKIIFSCPCVRCPVFDSLIWSNKTVNVKKYLGNE